MKDFINQLRRRTESGAERTHSRTLPRPRMRFHIPPGFGVRALCAAFLIAGVGIFAAEETNAVASAEPVSEPTAFDAFKIITQRNIFDPNRSAPGARRRDEDRPKPVKVDYLNLVGAMTYEKGQFAFFDGNSSEYRKSVKAGDSIAGCKVAEVTQSKVTLESDGKKIELPVGGQLKRQDEGEWHLNAPAESFSGAGESNGSSRRHREASSESASPKSSGTETKADDSSEPSDALKRMLERRKREQEK